MCGICGLINKDGSPVSRKILSEINDLAAHRGPDDFGLFIDGHVGLGHRRLSILDLSKAGHQPMSRSERYWITFNGEIYNYIELREELRREGELFVTGTDTEVILAAWQRWGEDALRRFNGMWAFAIYDKIEKLLVLSRDRFGVKPLYIRETPDHFKFSSEIKQLVKFGDARVNEQNTLNYLVAHHENIGEETMFRGVKTLAAGSVAYYNLRSATLKVNLFYKLKINELTQAYSKSDWIRLFSETFESAVRLRLRSDVKVGTCVSGGLDSAAVSGVASLLHYQQSTNRFLGIHAQGSEVQIDESAYARTVARAFNLELHILKPSYHDFVEQIDEVVYTQEEPFGSPSMFMGWHVFRKAKSLGCKVMLNGQGGDEVLLGYPRYLASACNWLRPIDTLSSVWAAHRVTGISFAELLAYQFYFRSSAIRQFVLERKSLVKKEWIDSYDKNLIRESTDSFQHHHSLQLAEITRIQLPHLLRYEDRNSMRHSIETRLPFLDYRLVELCVSAPLDAKLNCGWSKLLLRRSLQDILPTEIAWRGSKLGFEAPEQTWLGTHQHEILKEVIKSEIIRHYCNVAEIKNQWGRLTLKDRWSYYNLAVWARVFKVNG
jgi:asparagine synthase (glutamine-hydrolysing)